jgi:hypothetical protein
MPDGTKSAIATEATLSRRYQARTCTHLGVRKNKHTNTHTTKDHFNVVFLDQVRLLFDSVSPINIEGSIREELKCM